MKSIKQWFALGPDDDEDGREEHWYNRHYEWQDERIRFVAGDLLAINEYEGGGYAGPQFSVEVCVCQEGIPEFYLPDNKNAEYDIHYVSIVFWRWGIYLSVRGRVR